MQNNGHLVTASIWSRNEMDGNLSVHGSHSGGLIVMSNLHNHNHESSHTEVCMCMNKINE